MNRELLRRDKVGRRYCETSDYLQTGFEERSISVRLFTVFRKTSCREFTVLRNNRKPARRRLHQRRWSFSEVVQDHWVAGARPEWLHNAYGYGIFTGDYPHYGAEKIRNERSPRFPEEWQQDRWSDHGFQTGSDLLFTILCTDDLFNSPTEGHFAEEISLKYAVCSSEPDGNYQRTYWRKIGLLRHEYLRVKRNYRSRGFTKTFEEKEVPISGKIISIRKF